MASSSTSSIHKSFKYDVFLSFWGEDTRMNFVDHLYHALQQKSIHTYKDDPRINKEKNISDELIGSIEDSKFYIIVFSKNYASSSWCLDELVKIMECQRTTEHTAYPVFYDVEPSEVRKQSGAVAAAFAKLENEEAAGKWRDALKEATDLAGWELKNCGDGHEAKFIQKIVEELSIELRSISCKSFKYDVFLSFRSIDTRTNFVDHLYNALQNKNIHTYRYDEYMKKGKNISDELTRSIKGSKLYIIIFSANYISSSWCLDELVTIMESCRTKGHNAYAIFYDVEPSEIRKQSGAVEEYFAIDERKETAEIWREALKEALDLAGWELKKTTDGHEATLIQKLVEELSRELCSISFND